MRMGISKVVHKQNLQAGPAGLVFAGQMAKVAGLDAVARQVTIGRPQISTEKHYESHAWADGPGKN